MTENIFKSISDFIKRLVEVFLLIITDVFAVLSVLLFVLLTSIDTSKFSGVFGLFFKVLIYFLINDDKA